MIDSSGEGDLGSGGGAPRIIGDRYRVERVLGQGTSAVTLLCADLDGGQDVAVKELHYERLADWKYLDLFEREAKILSMLQHPGIPGVVDFFRSEGAASTLYLVQEFIDGPSLKQRMERGPLLGEAEVYDMALGLVEVLEYLHGRAPPVLHRDIKPSNILLRPNGAPVLIDFGGVCFGWRPPDYTGTTVVGTIGYMPPEQLLNQAGPVSDLYALGATLLHLVTGTPPHEFSFDTGRIEVPADLPARDSLRRLIEATLRPAPRDRPPSATAARAVLEDRSSALAVRDERHVERSDLAGLERAIPLVGERGPRFVDLGSPPRDPAGEFAHVYRNLVDPLNPFTRLADAVAPSRVLYVFLSMVTVGVFHLVYLGKVRDRKAKYDDLFRLGEFTRGRVVSVTSGDMFSTTMYEYQVAGLTYRGFIEYAAELRRYWNEGDTVGVLYHSPDPTRSCIVFG